MRACMFQCASVLLRAGVLLCACSAIAKVVLTSNLQAKTLSCTSKTGMLWQEFVLTQYLHRYFNSSDDALACSITELVECSCVITNS